MKPFACIHGITTITKHTTMLITHRRLIELFLSDVQDVPTEYQNLVRRRLSMKLSRYSTIDLITQAKTQWNWNLTIARSNTFLLEP